MKYFTTPSSFANIFCVTGAPSATKSSEAYGIRDGTFQPSLIVSTIDSNSATSEPLSYGK